MPYPSQFMELAVLQREDSVPRLHDIFRDRDRHWSGTEVQLFCFCTGSLLLSLGKADGTKEAPDIDFTACNHIWDCALMTVGCPTRTFSSNRHYFTHISPVYFSFP